MIDDNTKWVATFLFAVAGFILSVYNTVTEHRSKLSKLRVDIREGQSPRFTGQDSMGGIVKKDVFTIFVNMQNVGPVPVIVTNVDCVWGRTRISDKYRFQIDQILAPKSKTSIVASLKPGEPFEVRFHVADLLPLLWKYATDGSVMIGVVCQDAVGKKYRSHQQLEIRVGD